MTKTIKETWEEKLRQIYYGQFDKHGYVAVDAVYTDVESLISQVEALVRKEVVAEERQFILNVLDGIDIADKQMGITGGTKAIRFALQSRI